MQSIATSFEFSEHYKSAFNRHSSYYGILELMNNYISFKLIRIKRRLENPPRMETLGVFYLDL